MPTYRVKLANGKSLVMRGDEPPSDSDIEAAATSAGVRSLLMSSGGGETRANESSISPGIVMGGAALARPLVERLAMQTATSPNLGKAVGLVARPLASKTVGGVVGGVVGGWPGAAIGAVIPNAAVARTGARLAETGIRAAAGTVARAAGSRIAQAATGPAALAATATAEVLKAQHAARLNPALDPRTKHMSTEEIARDTIQRITGGGM